MSAQSVVFDLEAWRDHVERVKRLLEQEQRGKLYGTVTVHFQNGGGSVSP